LAHLYRARGLTRRGSYFGDKLPNVVASARLSTTGGWPTEVAPLLDLLHVTLF
jgi:hypothetical protein